MLEDMLSDYDRTKEAFGVIVRAALSELQCSDEMKAKLREAGRHVYQIEPWSIARATDLDRMFLTWLCADTAMWLYKKEPVWWYLPATVVEGVEFQIQSDEADERKRGKAKLNARDARVERVVAALSAGWMPEDAVVFARSKDEWAMACDKVGLEMDGVTKKEVVGW